MNGLVRLSVVQCGIVCHGQERPGKDAPLGCGFAGFVQVNFGEVWSGKDAVVEFGEDATESSGSARLVGAR